MARDTADRLHPICGQMLARLHHQNHSSKFLKIDALSGLKRVLVEEWDDVLTQMLLRPHSIGHPITVVTSYNTTTEE